MKNFLLSLAAFVGFLATSCDNQDQFTPRRTSPSTEIGKEDAESEEDRAEREIEDSRKRAAEAAEAKKAANQTAKAPEAAAGTDVAKTADPVVEPKPEAKVETPATPPAPPAPPAPPVPVVGPTKKLTLTWTAVTAPMLSYQIYLQDPVTKVETLVHNQDNAAAGFVATAPKLEIILATSPILKALVGTKVCLVVRGTNGLGKSEASDPICFDKL